MPSQYSLDIPFSASHDQQAFKLIELPPELLALLESENPPKSALTWLLSSFHANSTFHRLTVTSSTSTPTTLAYALLSAGSKTYQMRQKNTSSPIMILKPSSTGPTEVDDASTFIPVASISSIAKIEDTIELILQEPESVEKAQPKVNKWHEKFAKTRLEKKGWHGACWFLE